MIQEDENWTFAQAVNAGDIINIAGEIFEVTETVGTVDGRVKISLLLIAMEINHVPMPGKLANITVDKYIKLKIEE